MKKVLCVILTVVAILCAAIPVFAFNSKENPGQKYNVSVFTTVGGTVRYYTDTDGNLVFIADPYEGHEFTGWKIEGKYTIIEGDLYTIKIKIDPESDVKVVATYDGKSEPVKPWTDEESPKTGYSVMPAIILAAASLTGCAYCIKRSRED